MVFTRMLIGLGLGALLAGPVYSQLKPAESTSKLKKVLHFTKCGGWVHVDGQKDMTDVLNVLAKKKGFTVVHSADATLINLANLKTYNAVVWDNNVDGGASLPDPAARTAVIDYANQGGGWLLVHGAGDHHNSWAALQTVLGTTFSTHGAQGAGDIMYDAEATKHKELKYMIEGLPPKAHITKDEWYAFQNTLRGKPGVTVVATVGGGSADVILPYGDNSKPEDKTYVWAKEMGLGRTLYTAIGHGGNQLYAQADSFAVKSLYENLRYVAGDFKNGCTNKNAANFDPDARVDDGTCATTGLNMKGKPGNTLEVSYGSEITSIAFTHAGIISVVLRDAKGAVVWRKSIESGFQAEIDGMVRPGIYYITAIQGKNQVHQKLVLL